MKLTKNYIKQVIMEELDKLQEIEYSPEQKLARRKKAQTEFGNADDATLDSLANLADEIEPMNPNDTKLRAASIPKSTLDRLRQRASFREKFTRAGI